MEEPGTIQRTVLNSIQRIYTIAGQQSPRKHPAINLSQPWKMLDEGLVNSLVLITRIGQKFRMSL